MKVGVRGKLLLVSVAIIAVFGGVADTYVSRSLAQDLTTQLEADLFVRADLAAREASASRSPRDATAAWDATADDLSRVTRSRVSIIHADGALLGDSELDVAGLAGAEPHGDREEVRRALAGGRGSASRLSATLRSRMMYVAVPFATANGIRGVTRLAVPLTDVDAAIAKLRGVVLAGSGIAFLLAFAMSTLAAQLLSRRTRAFTEVARRMSSGELDARTRAVGNDEIAELGRALDALASSLFGALAELRTERDLLGGVLDGMREGVLLVDHEGRVAVTNPALREMLLLGADVAGKRPLELVRSAELKELLDGAHQDTGTRTAEIEIGELKPRRLLVHVTPLAGLAGTLAVFVDVTDMRRLESLRKDFVANVSHELRTPVATVLSATETLKDAGLVEGPPREFLDIIERNAQRLHRLVEDLLDLSRIESREFNLTLEPIEPASVVEQVVPLYRERADRKRVRVAIELGAGKVLADRRALEQILSNLVENAIKYTSEGSTVTLRDAATDETVALSVEDTGPGIEPRHLPRLFERFYRADRGRARDVGGTGLGLSIVKNLAEAMGGSVRVESEVGAGSTFTVTLPRST